MTKLGVALLGLDHWYAALSAAPQIAASDKVRLVSVSHDDAAKAEETARENGAEFHSTDYRAALDRPGVDIVVALYSTDRNPEIVQAAAAAGKHIVSVKPMAMNAEGADAIVAAVKSAGVHFFPYECLRRLSPEYQRIKRWLDEGRIGQPLRFTQTLHSSLPLVWRGQEGPSWWLDPARVPGGGWIDHSIYALDTVRWLFGSELASVGGVVGRMRYPELGVEDYGHATYTLANGAVATIEDTWIADRGFGLNRQEIVGSHGAIMDDGVGGWGGGRTHLRGDFGHEGWVTVDAARGPQTNPVDHLADAIRGDAKLAAGVEDARTNLLACLAFYRAAASGTVEKL
jgi:predicted dehydrogenase